METGRVFTPENGQLFHPANTTRRFIELYEEIDLPTIRFHDLRHGATTLARAAGADLKDIQEMLGHSSITITADTHEPLSRGRSGDSRGRGPVCTARTHRLRSRGSARQR